MQDSKCKICRRAGTKLFLKGEKCFSQKCPLVRRPYPAGPKKKRRFSPLSEYGKELMEKQKLKNWYLLRERQFKNYVKKVLELKKRAEDPVTLLIRNLETRLDNVIFRLGLVASRAQSKQMVSHGYFLVNGRKISAPSYQVKKGDIISLSLPKIKKTILQNAKIMLKKQKPPSWLELNYDSKDSLDKLTAKVIGSPSFEEAAPPAEISSIFEFYSR